MRIAALALVGAAAAALTLTGCAPAAHPTQTPTPKATAVFASDAEALAAAEKAYRKYRALAEQVLHDGGSDSGRLSAVATRTLLSDERAGDEKFKSNGYKAVGSSELISFALEQARLEGTPTGRDVVTAYACLDVSSTDVVDATGASVVQPNRPPKVGYEVTFDLVRGRVLPSSQEPWDSGGVCE